MRVLLWGTPEFAAPPLRALIGEGFDVAGVITQPDKPVGRSRSVLDAGPSILQVRTPIPDDETYGELELRLAEMGAMALIEALALIDLGKTVETPQDDSRATYAPKIERAQTCIHWATDAISVAR